jgi:hypothetical protein
VGSCTSIVGLNASHRDAAFCALVDTSGLAKELLATSTASSVIIYMVDHQVIPWCLITDRHDNALASRLISDTLANILYEHPDTTISIRWIPGSASFQPLKHILEVATVVAASANPANSQTPPTVAALRQMAKDKSLEDWEEIWLTDLKWNPAYQTLQHPPTGQAPGFISRIESFACSIFCTAIRLLTEHAFTGEYNTRHCPHAPDPHDCQCGMTPLQTAEHIITQCPLFNEARETLLHPVDPDLSPPVIFGTKAGGTALAKFIETTQACIRPRRRLVEDHGHQQTRHALWSLWQCCTDNHRSS